MKKLLLLFIILICGISVYGQSTTFKTDLVLDKTGSVADRIYLRGNGSLIDFMSGDMVLTHSSNQLSLSGGNLSLGTNSLLLTGSIGATGARVTKGWFTNAEFSNLPTIGGTSITTLLVPVTRTINTKPLSSNITLTATELGLGNVTNESKATMFASPVFTGSVYLPASWYIASAIVTSTAAELNTLHGVLVGVTQFNYLLNLNGNVQNQLNTKVSINNTSLTGITSVESLQIGTSANAIRIDGVTDIGQGYTFTKNGIAIPPNIPAANQINIADIPIVPTIYSAAGDTSNHPVPGKIGNIFINTAGSKIYISKSAIRGGWVILN